MVKCNLENTKKSFASSFSDFLECSAFCSASSPLCECKLVKGIHFPSSLSIITINWTSLTKVIASSLVK